MALYPIDHFESILVASLPFSLSLSSTVPPLISAEKNHAALNHTPPLQNMFSAVVARRRRCASLTQRVVNVAKRSIVATTHTTNWNQSNTLGAITTSSGNFPRSKFANHQQSSNGSNVLFYRGFAGSSGGKHDGTDEEKEPIVLTNDVDDDEVFDAVSGSSGKSSSPLEDLIRQRERGGKKGSGFDKYMTKKKVNNDDDDDDDKELKRRRKKGKGNKFDSEDMSSSSSYMELLELEDDLEDPTSSSYLHHHQDEESLAAADQKRRLEQQEEMNHKTGRGWTDPLDLDDMFASNESYDDLPDWTPDMVSKISQERVQIVGGSGSNSIPSLSDLARLPLPPPPHPHPGHGHFKAYAWHRARTLAAQVHEKVVALAAPRVAAIQALPTWQDKQDAVDELFERIEFTLREQEPILGKHPKFGQWVERALEKYLQSIRRQQTEDSNNAEGSDAESGNEQPADDKVTAFPTKQQDEEALPMFLDCFNAEVDTEEENIPQILYPLAPLKRGANQGRMMEEWMLAAHKTTKRILLRQSTRGVAQFLEQCPSGARVLVTGRQGTGKTATLLSLVAAARQSGHIVMFMPHCSILAEHGYYIEPNEHRPGMFDLPVLSEQVCQELLKSHKDDLASIPVNADTIKVFFSESQLVKLGESDSLSVADLLSTGAEKRPLAPMCYSAAIDTLMKQDEKPFTMVLDEFNTFYDTGKYFHEEYDPDVRKPIPYDKISLFQPLLDAMGLVSSTKELLPEPVLMKRGAVIAAMSYSKPVANIINEGLVASAKELAAAENTNMYVADVPRLSNLEVDHVMANYESIGFGKLRMDQGETVTNAQEVAYLRILSSNVPQELMNACIL